MKQVAVCVSVLILVSLHKYNETNNVHNSNNNSSVTPLVVI